MKGKTNLGGWGDAQIFTLYNSAIDDGKNEGSNSSYSSFLSFQRLRENTEKLEAISIRIKEIELSTGNCLLVEITDFTDVQTKGISRLQSLFQKMLTNALSHERLTPLNTIVNLSSSIRKRCKNHT